MANFFKKIMIALQMNRLEHQLDVKVRLLRRDTKAPITGEGWLVRFYDKDKYDNDFLGEGTPNPDGIVDIRFNPSAMQQGEEEWGDEFETKPDLFFELWKGEKLVFTSKVWDDVDFDTYASYDIEEGKEVNFGTFLIDTQGE